MTDQPSDSARAPERKPRSAFSHYLPRLRREFYQADAVVFWTMPVAHRAQGWLDDCFHSEFREMMLHAAAREGLSCPAYCLMADHVHFVWMGLRRDTDQRNGIKFLRAQLGPLLKPATFQHQAHDHVLTARERRRHAFTLACPDYVLLNPLRAGLVKAPENWPYLGAVVPGYPRPKVFKGEYWQWFWKHYFAAREPGIEKRVLPRARWSRRSRRRQSALILLRGRSRGR
jgi:REP element-mobilizing transposase RayT